MVNESAKSQYLQARQKWDEGDRTAAHSLYRAALVTDPTFALPHFDLGSLLETSDPAASRNHYARFIELAAGDERLAGLVGQAAHKLASAPQPTVTRAVTPAPRPTQPASPTKPARRKWRKWAWTIVIFLLAYYTVLIVISDLQS